jgi:hypothetical protein
MVATNARRPASKSVERQVLIASRRRCCLRVFLTDRNDVRKGQIAHLNRDRGDSRYQNLVYLCFEHHDEYDSQPSQSKGLTPEEVREYRDRLYARNGESPTTAAPRILAEPNELSPPPDTSEYEELRSRFSKDLEFTRNPWRYPLWQVANEPELFAYKAGNRADGVCLIERIDLPDGRIVIVCMAVIGNPGNSITNCVEELCLQVCERFEIPAERLVWLEHYEYYDDSKWNMVEFKRMPPDHPFEDPTWTPMTPAAWHDLRLRPRKRLRTWFNSYQSKIIKLFPWPDEALL